MKRCIHKCENLLHICPSHITTWQDVASHHPLSTGIFSVMLLLILPCQQEYFCSIVQKDQQIWKGEEHLIWLLGSKSETLLISALGWNPECLSVSHHCT